MSDNQPSAHIIFAAMPFWGHARPMLALALNLATLFPNLHITFLATKVFSTNIPREFLIFDPPEGVLDRIRVVPLGNDGFDPKDWISQSKSLLEKLPEVLIGLFSDNEGTGFSKPPTLAIADLLFATWAQDLKNLAADTTNNFTLIPTLAFSPTPATWCLYRLDTPGSRLFTALTSDPANATKPIEEIVQQAYTHTEGELMRLTGIQPMYDYELQPQLGAIPFNPVTVQTVLQASAQLKDCAGFILSTSPDLEPGVKHSLAKAIEGECFQVGPQFPEQFWRRTEGIHINPNSLSDDDRSLLSFLDSAEQRFGKKSVMYISFGSLYSPSKRPDLLETLVTSLLEADPPFPFVFATATTHHLISDRVHDLVRQSGGLGIFSKFAPQQMVLQHPAAGWFLTHGGSGSVSDAILNKTPMLLWPCMTDQPIAASILTMNLRVAFELIQVRTGPSVGKPSFRGPTTHGTIEAIEAEMKETWGRMRGPEGKAVRARLNDLHEKLKLSWESGEARKDMLGLAKYF